MPASNELLDASSVASTAALSHKSINNNVSAMKNVGGFLSDAGSSKTLGAASSSWIQIKKHNSVELNWRSKN